MALDRVWFSSSLSYTGYIIRTSLSLTGYIISRKSVLISVHDLCESVLIISRALGHKQGTKMERVVLNRVCIFGIFCPKQGQGFKPYSGSPIPKYWSSTLPLPLGLEYSYRIDVHIKGTVSRYCACTKL